jgi:hypothetical protein
MTSNIHENPALKRLTEVLDKPELENPSATEAAIVAELIAPALDKIELTTWEEIWEQKTEEEKLSGISTTEFQLILDPSKPADFAAISLILERTKAERGVEGARRRLRKKIDAYVSILENYYQAKRLMFENHPDGRITLDSFLQTAISDDNIKIFYNKLDGEFAIIPNQEYYETALFLSHENLIPDEWREAMQSMGIVVLGCSTGTGFILKAAEFGIKKIIAANLDKVEGKNLTRLPWGALSIGENKAALTTTLASQKNPYAPLSFHPESISAPLHDPTNIETLMDSDLYKFLQDLKDQGLTVAVVEQTDSLPFKVATGTICDHLGVPLFMNSNAETMVNFIQVITNKGDNKRYFNQEKLTPSFMKQLLDDMGRLFMKMKSAVEDGDKETIAMLDDQMKKKKVEIICDIINLDGLPPGQMLNFLRIAFGETESISQTGANSDVGAGIAMFRILETLVNIVNGIPFEASDIKFNTATLDPQPSTRHNALLRERLKKEKEEPHLYQPILTPHSREGDTLAGVIAKVLKELYPHYDYPTDIWGTERPTSTSTPPTA